MLGVIIGVMSVTIIVMVSSGFQDFMRSQFDKLGADSIMVFFDPGRRNRDTLGKTEGLRIEDVDYLANRVSVIDLVTPIMQPPAQKVSYLDKTVDSPRIYASSEHYADLNRMNLTSGHWFGAGEVAQRANVCLIGQDIRDQLFDGVNPDGKYVTFSGITLEVIGVFEKTTSFGQTNGKDILMPITTAQDKWLGTKDLMMIMAKPKPGVTVDTAMDRMWEALMLKTGNKQLFRVDSNQSIMAVFGAVFGAAGMILAAIAALSLLVGGIGIMNIMLVSVTERTREIGLRKAVGGRASSILLQFLVEAGTLSLVGGLIGMGIAWMIGNLVTIATAAMKWPSPAGLATPFPITAALGAAAFSALIGMVFGFYPALSAARLDPIVALRHE
jgi:putative ABC transport system permease protein